MSVYRNYQRNINAIAHYRMICLVDLDAIADRPSAHDETQFTNLFHLQDALHWPYRIAIIYSYPEETKVRFGYGKLTQTNKTSLQF